MTSLSLARFGRAALDLLYPPRCLLCHRGGDFLCAGCLARLPLADGRRCDVCWLPLEAAECPHCRAHPLALRLRSAFRYGDDVKRVVHAFKFGRQSCLAPLLGQALLKLYRTSEFAVDAIVPVPLTGRRRRERGFNQAALLAAELARDTGLPVAEALARTTMRQPQAGSASAEQRWLNVQGAFRVVDSDVVTGRRLLLIDDVATTGATLDSCARALIGGGAREVFALTIARED
jgi:ComF family protein